MVGSSDRASKMAPEGDQERSDIDRSQVKDSSGDEDGWQTVAHGKNRKSVDKNPALPTPSPRRGAPGLSNQAIKAQPDRRDQDLLTPETSSSNYPTLIADVAPALNAREFPSLPTKPQSEQAIQKVMAKKKKKHDKRKKKRSALESKPSQSSSGLLEKVSVETPMVTHQEMTITPHSQLSGNLVQQGSHEIQEPDPDGAADTTDEDITPNASMLNLVASFASQPGSTSVPPSASASQSVSPSTPPSDSASQPESSSALPPATSPAAHFVHKFGAFRGSAKIVCCMPGCDNTTSPWDGSAVICPSCGPYSSIRYCCIEHLLNDTTSHWAVDCMKYTCRHLCDASTIHPRQIQCPPAIPNFCGWNTPERHRQAVYHAHSSKKNGSAEVEGDYFIFTDAEEWIQAGSPNMQVWGLRRARGALLVVVTFDDERSPNFLKDRFYRLLNIALATGASNAILLDYLFLMIRENLMGRGEWDDDILDCIVYQFQWEFCYQVPEWITNNLRHACPHQWFGTPVDQCQNIICNRQILQPRSRHPLAARISIKEKAEELERRYWILRVARVYHPNIQNQARRMRGVGFDFVLPENRRMFCMGREWEGYPRGTMEVEDSMWVRTPQGPPRLQVANLMTLTV